MIQPYQTIFSIQPCKTIWIHYDSIESPLPPLILRFNAKNSFLPISFDCVGAVFFFSSALINHQMWFIVNQWFPKGETTKKAFKTCSFSDLRFHQGFGKCPNYWGFWTSFFESICWRLYPQSLGGVKNWDIDQPLPEMIQWAEDNKQYGFIVNYQFFISIVCLTARNDS